MSGVQLNERISLVGGGSTGIGISHSMDPNVYLLSGREESALVDCGSGLANHEILANIRSLGHDPRRIRHIFLTHAHADHAGGCTLLAEELSARVYLSSLEKEALETADEDALGLTIARRSGFYPQDYRLRPCKIDVALQGGEKLACGDLELEVLATPGHSAGSLCFLVRTEEGVALFSGDTVFCGGKISLLVCPGSDLLSLACSVESLGEYEIDALLPGHGLFCLRNAQEHVRNAVEAFESMVPPPSILQ